MVHDRGRARIVDERAAAASIVASSHDAIVGMTRAGVITSCNPAAAHLFGSPARNVVGHPAEEFVAPECRAAEAALLRRIVAGEVVEPYHSERVSKDGSVVKVAASISPIVDSDGVIVGAATALRQISDRQQAHDRFEVRLDERRLGRQGAAKLLDARADQERAEVRDAAARFEARVDVQRQDASDAAERFEALVVEKPASATTLIAKAGQVLNGHFCGFQAVRTDDVAQPDN